MALALPDLGSALEVDLTYLALCWRIVRRDGCALGFTTHDRALLIKGLRYDSTPGMAPSAVVCSDGLEVDTMDVAGALSSRSIRADDLLDGRYDGAAVDLFLVDWRNPDAGGHRLAAGTVGTVEAGYGADASFSATLRGLTAQLAAPRIESYSPECRAELGDWRCRVPLRGRTWLAELADVEESRLRIAGMASSRAADFVQGQVRFLDGPAAGLDRRIVTLEADWLHLDAPVAPSPGGRVRLIEGCDKRFATCVQRFGNANNFRGEPHVPGNDLLTRFGV